MLHSLVFQCMPETHIPVSIFRNQSSTAGSTLESWHQQNDVFLNYYSIFNSQEIFLFRIVEQS